MYLTFQAIVGMLSAIDLDFFTNCYSPLGDLVDDIALLNCSINFVVYYLMSRQFRKTFLEHFGLTWCDCPSDRNRRGSNNGGNNDQEMRPLMAVAAAPDHQRPHQNVTSRPLPPLQPRPQIVMSPVVEPINEQKPKLLVSENGAAALAAPTQTSSEAAKGPLVTISQHKYVLKRTNDPEEQV